MLNTNLQSSILLLLMENNVNTYIAVVLSESSRKLLLELQPAIHPDVIAHHVTLNFPFDARNLLEEHIDYPVNFLVEGYNSNPLASVS